MSLFSVRVPATSELDINPKRLVFFFTKKFQIITNKCKAPIRNNCFNNNTDCYSFNFNHINRNKEMNSVACSPQAKYTERALLVGEVIVNFSG